jgi:hypothetical protein
VARLLGAADAIRHSTGEFRFPVYQGTYTTALEACRSELGEDAFQAAWTDGAGLPTDDVITYALRGRGERKRPASGWASLTPAELDVARLVSEGLPNKDIAERLFIPPHRPGAPHPHVHQAGLHIPYTTSAGSRTSERSSLVQARGPWRRKFRFYGRGYGLVTVCILACHRFGGVVFLRSAQHRLAIR